MSAFDILETTLDPVPLFPVEEPDGRKDLSELERQTLFRRYAATLAPQVVVWANANAGKRNPTQARREGIVAGVFDIACAWDIRASTITAEYSGKFLHEATKREFLMAINSRMPE